VPNQLTLGVIMDPIQSIHPEKDTTLALLFSAQKKGFQLYYLELNTLFWHKESAFGNCRQLRVFNQTQDWYALSTPDPLPLSKFDVLLMRKDPPVNMTYIYATYFLEQAEQNGTLVINKPQSLRDVNEKVFATWFPQCLPPTLVSCSKILLKEFIEAQECVVLKPLNGMGGQNIFKCERTDVNQNAIIDLLTQQGSQYIMAQRFLPEIFSTGDKRILLIDGEPLPYALARFPTIGEFRGNLAAGGQGSACKLNARDYWLCQEIGPILQKKGLTFVGIDVIGDYLTEINVTSPTCVKELEKACKIEIADKILDCIIDKLNKR
jgi:glutathione synthase